MKSNWLFLPVLFLVGFLLYGQSLKNPFVFDDELQITNNLVVKSFDVVAMFSGSTFTSYGKNDQSGIYFKPLQSLSYGILWQVGQGNSFPFHLFQLIIAILNSFLFFYILSHWLNKIYSLLLAILFLVHPINSEVVLYIADLQDVLFSFWGLLSLVLLIRQRHWVWISLCLLFSLLSKESGIIFIFAIPVISWLINPESFKQTKIYAMASVISFGVYSIFRFGILSLTTLSYTNTPIGQIEMIDRIITFPKEVFYYLTTFFWPASITLHQNWVVTSVATEEFYVPVASAAVFAILILFVLRKVEVKLKFPALVFIVLLIFNFGLHANIIIPLDATVANRWFYIGSLSLIGFIGIALRNLLANHVRLAAVGWLVITLALSARTYSRTADWKSGMALFTEAVESSPTDENYNNSLGLEFYRAGDLVKAEQFFRKSVALDPKARSNWNNLGTVEVAKGNYKAAEEYFAKAINNGQYPLAIENYARLLRLQNRNEELKVFLKTAFLVLPNNKFLLELKANGF